MISHINSHDSLPEMHFQLLCEGEGLINTMTRLNHDMGPQFCRASDLWIFPTRSDRTLPTGLLALLETRFATNGTKVIATNGAIRRF